MGIIVRQSVQNTIISYLGIALGFVLTIWLFPRILTSEQYGLTRVLLSFSLVCTQFANLGMSNTIIRFFPRFKDRESNHHGFLFLALMVPLAGFLLFTALFLIFKDFILTYYIEKSGLLLDYYLYLLPLVFFELYFQIFRNYVRALYDTVTASFLKENFTRILTIILLVVFYMEWISFDLFVLLFVGIYGITMLLLAVYLSFLQDIDLSPDFEYLSESLIKKMASYSMFAFWGGIASILVGQIDILMLAPLAGLNNTGVYAIAFYVGSVIAIPRKSIQKITTPIVSNAFKENNLNLIEDIYRRSSLNQIIAGGLLFCGIWGNLHNLLAILPDEYAAGSLVIIIIGVANLFDMATGINGAIILQSKYYRFDLYSTLFLIALAVTLNFLLIPVYGINGAAVATASAIFFYNLLKLVYVWIRFSMQPFRWNMLLIIAIGALSLWISFSIGQIGGTYIDILVRSAVITLVYIGLMLALRISDDLNALVRRMLDQVLSFISIK